MKSKIIFLSLVFITFYLSACSTVLIKPKEPIENFNYKINNAKNTVKIINQKSRDRGLHWIYLKCDYIFGCYMRCEGPINSCMKVATLSNYQIRYITTKIKGHYEEPKWLRYYLKLLDFMGINFWARITIGATIAVMTLYIMWE